MKKVYTGSILVLIVLLLTFFGCGGGGGSSSSTPKIVENSSYGDYAIAGKNNTELSQEDEDVIVFKNAQQMLRGNLFSTDKYMLQFDLTDPLGWVGISSNGKIALKLDGIEDNGSLKWISLQDETLTSFVDIYFDEEKENITFGSILESDDSVSDFVSKLTNKTFPIQGMIVHYLQGEADGWVYVTFDTQYVGLLNGMDSSSGMLQWDKMYTASLNSAAIGLRDTSKTESFDEVGKNKDASKTYYNGDGNRTITASIIPKEVYASYGESRTFKFSLTNNATGETITPKDSVKWISGPTLTCDGTDYGFDAIACSGTQLCAVGFLMCNHGYIYLKGGASQLFLGESTKFTARFGFEKNGEEITDTEISDESVVWKSSTPSIAGVSADGLVTCRKGGAATITASAFGYSASQSLKCIEKFLFTINGPSELYVPEKGKFSAKVVSKTDGASRDVKVWYESSNLNVATILDGIVTCISVGITTIKGSLTDFHDDYFVKANPEASQALECKAPLRVGLFLAGKSPMEVDESSGYKAIYRNPFMKSFDVTTKSDWSSLIPAIASVNAKTGVVTCHTVGKSVITATYESKDILYENTAFEKEVGLVIGKSFVECEEKSVPVLSSSSESSSSEDSSSSSEVSSSSTESSSSSSIPEVSSSSSLSSSSNSSEGSTSSSDYTGTKTWVISPTAVGMSTFSIVDVRYTVTDFDNNAEKLEDKLITAECGFEVSSGSDVIDIKKVGDNLEITGKKDGTATITITIPSKYTDGADYVNKTIVVNVTGVS